MSLKYAYYEVLNVLITQAKKARHVARTQTNLPVLFSQMTQQAYTDISLPELEMLRQQPGAVVVDVRDDWEFEEFNLGGINVPLADIRTRRAELLPYDPIIVMCSNGVRSRVAAKDLLRQAEFTRKTIYHLHGGIVESE